MKAVQLLACLIALCLSVPALAQNGTTSAKPPVKTKTAEKTTKEKNKPSEISETRKAELLAFVDKHHPELKKLLSRLEKGKKKRPWIKAMTSLNRTVKKLEGVKERTPHRYETALKQWKLESRIQVASAELKHKDSEEGRKKLKKLVTQLVDHHIARMKDERENMRKRLKQIDKKIDDAVTQRDANIEKRVKWASPKEKKEKPN